MNRNRDHSGVPQTCPKIDNVISFLENIDWDANEDDLNKGAKEMCQTLEEIRKHNSDLREWGHSNLWEKLEFEKEMDYLQKEVEKLKSEIEDLKGEITELQEMADSQ